jgi:transposase-like protein
MLCISCGYQGQKWYHADGQPETGEDRYRCPRCSATFTIEESADTFVADERKRQLPKTPIRLTVSRVQSQTVEKLVRERYERERSEEAKR